MFIFKFPGELVRVGMFVEIVIDADDFNDSGDDAVYLSPVSLGILVLKFLTQNTEINDVAKVVVSFLTKSNLVFKPAICCEIIGVTALDLGNYDIIGFGRGFIIFSQQAFRAFSVMREENN